MFHHYPGPAKSGKARGKASTARRGRASECLVSRSRRERTRKLSATYYFIVKVVVAVPIDTVEPICKSIGIARYLRTYWIVRSGVTKQGMDKCAMVAGVAVSVNQISGHDFEDFMRACRTQHSSTGPRAFFQTHPLLP